MAATRMETHDLPRNMLVVLFILSLIAGCLWVLRPFLTALICATTIAIATWPMLTGLQRRWGGNRALAIAALMGALSIAFLGPICFGTIAAVQSVGTMAAWMKELPNRTLPAPPDWIVGLPVVGPRFQQAWGEVTAGGAEGIKARLSENAAEILRWLIGRLGNLAGMLVQVLVTIGITGLIYARGERVAAALLKFSRRLGGDRGEEAARLAAQATRGVALGVVLTPVIQSILAGIGMVTAGIPHPGLFSILVLVSCLAQAGPILPLLIPVAWLFAKGQVLPASGLAAWALVVHITGPVVRPLLIKRGVDLPLPVILAGVIGGVSAFGVVGLFLGPVLLAVGATLLGSWIAEGAGGGVEAADAGSATRV